MTTGTIIGRRRVRSCTKRPRAERALRLRVSKSAAPGSGSSGSSIAASTTSRASSSNFSASGAWTQPRVIISGPVRTLPVRESTDDDEDDDALFGQELAVPQDPGADVADDPVNVQVAGRHLAGELDAARADLYHVAVLGQQDRLAAAPRGRWPGGRGASGGGTRRARG